MKSVPAEEFYQPTGSSPQGREQFVSTPRTVGPWRADAQHGGPPAALLGRALEALDEGTPRLLGSFTMDLLGPVPVGTVSVASTVLRPGRSVSLREAVLYDDTAARPVARARAWAFPLAQGPATTTEPLPHSPADGRLEDPPPAWHSGYLDAMEWRWIQGAVTRPGPAVVWMRPLVGLVAGEQISPLQRLLTCVDSTSGASSVLDPAEWAFLNTELTVHLVRPPVGEWVCLQAETTLGGGSVGTAVSTVYDSQGVVARSAQALLVAAARS